MNANNFAPVAPVAPPQPNAGNSLHNPSRLGRNLFDRPFVALGFVGLVAFGIVQTLLSVSQTRNTAVQTCLGLMSVGDYSTECNDTVARGVSRSPLVRRDLAVLIHNKASVFAQELASVVVLTIAAGIFTIVWFRPKMDPFHPVISLARYCYGRKGIHRPQLNTSEVLLVSTNQIGIFYESDDDELETDIKAASELGNRGGDEIIIERDDRKIKSNNPEVAFSLDSDSSDDCAIDDTDYEDASEDDWEDSSDEIRSLPSDEKHLFRRLDSPSLSLTSRRPLLTQLIHEPERGRTLTDDALPDHRSSLTSTNDGQAEDLTPEEVDSELLGCKVWGLEPTIVPFFTAVAFAQDSTPKHARRRVGRISPEESALGTKA